jgi:hypothetical protein
MIKQIANYFKSMYKITADELKEITNLLDNISKLKKYNYKPSSYHLFGFDDKVQKLSNKSEKLSNKIKSNYPQ